MGGNVFNDDGDAHALLMAVYKNLDFSMDARICAAKAAVRFEKPALASTDNRNTDMTRWVVALPDGEVSLDEWKAKDLPAAIGAKETDPPSTKWSRSGQDNR